MPHMSVHPNAAARFSLAGKIAWITGGAGLLGSAVCRGLAEQGAHVVVCDVRPEEAQKLADALKADGLAAEPMTLDIGDESAVGVRTDELVSRHGRIDVLVNMAFFYTKTPWEQMSTEQWEKGMRVTLTGAFLIGRECARVMKAQKRGSMIQFSSMYGVVSPDPRMYPPRYNVNPIDYGVAKAGVLQMVRYQAVMLAPYNVRVNAIVPGPFPYPWSQGADTEFVDKLASKVPMGRVGQAQEMAGAVIFLASDASSYITGTHIAVDGGWTAW